MSEVNKSDDTVDSTVVGPEDDSKITVDAGLQSSDKDIVEQLTFYLSDLNLMKDTFTRDLLEKDDGWIRVDVFVKYNRLGNITKDPDVILKAVLNEGGDFLQANEEKKAIRRNPDKPVMSMDPEWRKQLFARSLYLKGFPADAKLEDIEKFFKGYTTVDGIAMRYKNISGEKKKKTRIFKTSIYVAFPTKEEAEKFFTNAPLKYNDAELTMKAQDDYFKEKMEKYNKKKEERKNARKNLMDNGLDEVVKNMPRGALIRLTGFGDGNISPGLLKKTINEKGYPVAFVQRTLTEDVAVIRFHEENKAKEFIASLGEDASIMLNEVKLSVTLIEGEEEQEILNKMACERKIFFGKGKRSRGKKRPYLGSHKRFNEKGDSTEKDSNENGKDVVVEKDANGGETASKKMKISE